MAIPTSKDTLKEHCLRSLGKPVIDVNVDPDQCDDRIDDALQYFAEYHMDGVERMYLKYKMTANQITRARTDGTSSVTDTVDNSGGAYAWLEQKVWMPIPSSVISVLRIFPMTDQTQSPMFDMKYQMRLNDLWDFTSTSVINYQMLQSHLDLIDHLFTGEVPIRFNQHQNRIYFKCAIIIILIIIIIKVVKIIFIRNINIKPRIFLCFFFQISTYSIAPNFHTR